MGYMLKIVNTIISYIQNSSDKFFEFFVNLLQH